MKFLATILLSILTFCISKTANSQTVASDTMFVKGSYKIQKVEVDRFSKDTATHFTYSVFGVSSDTSKPANSYIQFFDKNKKPVLEKNLIIPPHILKLWIEDWIIVDWICYNFGLTKLE